MKWFKNLNAVPKIMSAIGGMLLLLVLMGFLALGQISQLNEQTLKIFNRDVGGIDAIKQAEVDQAMIARILATSTLAQGNAVAVGFAEHDFATLLLDLRASLTSAYERSTRSNLRENLQSNLAGLPNLEVAAHQLFVHAKMQDRAAAAASLKAATMLSDQLRESLHQAAEMKKANVELFKAESQLAAARTRTQFIVVVCVSVAFLSFAGFLIARSFSKPLTAAVLILNKVEQGDLTQRLSVETTDEIGQLARAVNSALSNISEVISQVGESARSLSSASSQLAKSTDIMASGAHEQAASLEETSASLEQITATVRQNSDNARQASQFALSSHDAAEKGGIVVHDVISAMDEINEASSKIAAIIRVIDEIAFQTNLLAVNASVEAARAREHGKGFAVVATEIRTLAQRSGIAAKEIKTLIADSRRKVEKGSHLVNRSGQTLTEIVSSVKRVTDIVSEIAAASREQSTGIEQVNSAMLQMDSVMQSNSSQTEQLSATANTLAANALQLEKSVSRFVVAAASAEALAPPASVTPPPPPAPVDAAGTTSSDLAGLAASLANTGSMAALDEEFKEF